MMDYKYERINFSMPIGSTSADFQSKIFRQGEVIAAAIFPDGAIPAETVNLGLRNTSGTRVVETTTVKDWERREGGSYIDSMKPMLLEGGQYYTLEFNALTALTTAFSGQVVFVINPTC